MPRLFTKSDLERAARLATTAALLQGGDPETHIAAAVTTVAGEVPVYYDEKQIRQMLAYVAERIFSIQGGSRVQEDPEGPYITEWWKGAVRALLDGVDHRAARD